MINHKDCKVDRDCAKCIPKHPKPKKIILECGEGTGRRTFTSSEDAPFQLARVTLDTTCLNKPKGLIKFSSLVCMDNLAIAGTTGTVRLQYELFKFCDNEKPISLGTWIFEQVNVSSAAFDRQEESFSFMFCECTNCSECCEYVVTVTPIEITSATATVSNGRIAALSGSSHDCVDNECNVYDFKDNRRKEKHIKPKEILSVCGSGNGSSSYRVPTELPPPTGIAHATVDTTCLMNPKVLIEFSSNIAIIATENLRLQFELFRVCGDGEPVSRGIWSFERTGAVFFLGEFIEKVFNFSFCECKVPSSCCEYFVILTVNEISANNDLVDVVVDNVRMNALAQGSSDCFNNDNSKSHYIKGDCIDCIPKHPKPKEIILECGSGVGSRRFTQASTERFQVGHVTIDTTCLCKPMVNIEFSSTIGFEVQQDEQDETLQLQVELFRACDNRSPIPIGVWVLENFDQLERSMGAYHFIACDCITCPGCCDYFVTVTPFGAIGSNSAVTVSNVRIAALAQEI